MESTVVLNIDRGILCDHDRLRFPAIVDSVGMGEVTVGGYDGVLQGLDTYKLKVTDGSIAALRLM